MVPFFLEFYPYTLEELLRKRAYLSDSCFKRFEIEIFFYRIKRGIRLENPQYYTIDKGNENLQQKLYVEVLV